MIVLELSTAQGVTCIHLKRVPMFTSSGQMRSRIPMHPLHQDQGAMHFPFRSKAKDKTPTRSNIQHLVSPSGRLLLTELTTSTFDSENKIDRIVNRIEELNQTIQQLSLNQSGPKYHGTALNPQTSQTAFRPTPAASEPTPSNPSSFVDESPPYSSKPEYEGESSLFAHAVFATKFLQNSVRNNSSSEVALEMTSVLNALRGVIDAQKQESDTVENLYPNALPLPPGTSLRKLPMPSTEKAMACLRIAQGRFALENKSQATDTSKDSTPIQILWLMDLQTIPEFTTHFIKVCSPGPVTEADLIIFYLGLYWLFCECTNVVEDESLKKEYTAQSIICRDSLETVLSRLPFHMPATLEHVLALCMAVSFPKSPENKSHVLINPSHCTVCKGASHQQHGTSYVQPPTSVSLSVFTAASCWTKKRQSQRTKRPGSSGASIRPRRCWPSASAALPPFEKTTLPSRV